jgi:hypothetical protein
MKKYKINDLKKTGLSKLLNFITNKGLIAKITFLFMGIASTIWFLIRVIPKPSRASYPCMRAAAPFMSGFVLYLLSISGAFAAFRKSRELLKKAKYISAFVLLILAIVAGAISFTINTRDTSAKVFKAAELPEGPNIPMGVAKGILPGRVVWAWDKDATNENCTNDYGESWTTEDNDGYYMNKNNDQDVIDRMTKDVILQLTGKSNIPEAWDAMFKHFNNKKGKGEIGYTTGETIFIKINQGTSGWAAQSDYSRMEFDWAYAKSESTAQMPLCILKQLIEDAGVPQENIYIGDPIAHIWADVYDILHNEYPNVKYVDKSTSNYGRTRIYPETTASMVFSDKGHVVDATTDKVYDVMADADYLINLACLKAHERAGITLCTKNHFGSHTRSAASHMHPGLVWIEEWGGEMRDSYGMYRVLVEWMGHEKVGGNTLLFVIDGLWGGPEATMKPVKWHMYPFDNDWPNSILASLDPVALESVCYDFLRTEFTLENHPDPWEGKTITFSQYNAIDDYLHQAASNTNWPSQIYSEGGSPADFAGYDPEGDGTFLSSLGVHEHWNNEIAMQYSRNLGTGNGIELVKIRDKEEVPVEIHAKESDPPVIDGEGTDLCWYGQDWIYIDQTWIPYGADVSSNDFSGAFKVVWSGEDSLLYILAETIDESFIDTTDGLGGDYYEYDVLEIFIDEDKSGGGHIFDDGVDNAENAFSYHISIVIPEDGQTTTGKKVYDIDGTSWGDVTNPDYADHFPDFAVKRTGNKLTWEFSMKVYNDTYEQLDPAHENAWAQLDSGKTIGFSVAYCDADDNVGRDNFFGSDWGPDNGGEFNDHWMNADGYGTLVLTRGTYIPNYSPQLTGSIDNIELDNLNTDVVACEDIKTLFYDPNGDSLIFGCESDNADLTVWLDEYTLKVRGEDNFEGSAVITVYASDEKGGNSSAVFDVSYEDINLINTEKFDNLKVYPNPLTDGKLNLIYESNNSENILVTIYGTDSKTLKKFSFTKAEGIFRKTLDLTDLEQGIYLVRININGTIIIKKIKK